MISQRDMLCSVLTTILSILVTGHDTVDEEDEESVDEDLDEVSPYASAAKVSATHTYHTYVWYLHTYVCLLLLFFALRMYICTYYTCVPVYL